MESCKLPHKFTVEAVEDEISGKYFATKEERNNG